MARFVLFGAHGDLDVVVNADHVISVDQIGDSTQAGERDTCRLFLSGPIWVDHDQDDAGMWHIDVIGCLFEVHRMLNGDKRE